MPEGKLDATDAAGLAEMLQFLSEWLTRDPARLGAALAQFAGHLACGLAQLRGDLERFVSCLAAATASSSPVPAWTAGSGRLRLHQRR